MRHERQWLQAIPCCSWSLAAAITNQKLSHRPHGGTAVGARSDHHGLIGIRSLRSKCLSHESSCPLSWVNHSMNVRHCQHMTFHTTDREKGHRMARFLESNYCLHELKVLRYCAEEAALSPFTERLNSAFWSRTQRYRNPETSYAKT